mgnify:CR=1 FL=1
MTRGNLISIKSKSKSKSRKTLKINDLVYVAGDYFDYDEKNRWSKNVAKIDYTKSSLIGLVKSFDIHNNQRYSNVLWFADFREQSVLLKDLTLLPKNLKPIKKALAFSESIEVSKIFSREFSSVINEYIESEKIKDENKVDLNVEIQHIDGTFNADLRNHLYFLSRPELCILKPSRSKNSEVRHSNS